MYSPKLMKESFVKNNFSFKKKFGQNFIVDENIINNIVSKANILTDSLIIEIGPGAGSLTNKLRTVAKQVICYEIDVSLKPFLENIGANVEVIFADFLNCDVINDVKKYSYSHLYVIANLPYYITTPIIMKIISANLMVDKIVIMVQKEVGNRFKALPGSKDYNSLSVFLNYYFDVKKVMDVSRNVFMPKPNVDSIVISLSKKDQVVVSDEILFFKVIRDSFKQKRKMLRNNLQEYDLDIVFAVLNKHGFDKNVRAEQLSLAVFVDIANNLKKHY